MKLFARNREMHRHSSGAPLRIVVNGAYKPDTVNAPAGEPVRLVFHRHDASACSEEVVFPTQGVRATLARHRDVAVDLPPSEAGVYEFHCGMNMLRGRLIVTRGPRRES